jgi:predicted porin
MQKKIIALAIAAAISAPAFADTSNVNVYGVADVSYDIVRTGNGAVGTAATQGTTSARVSSNSTRIGLKGAEDLGEGLSAIWQVESLISVGNTAAATAPGATAPNGATGGAQIGNRNTFLGLSSAEAGTVVLGRHDTPYKISTRAYDYFTDGIADSRSITGGGTKAVASFDGRQDQVVAYISPKLGGVATLAVGYVNLSPINSLSTQSKDTAWSMAGMFDIGSGFGGALAYEVHDIGAGVLANAVGNQAAGTNFAAAAKEKATKLGLSYAQDGIAVNFAYEKTSDNAGALAANAFGHSDYYLSGKFNFTAADAIKGAYTKANTINGATGTDASQVTVGYDHLLSKRTTIYALYTKLSNGTTANYNLGSGISSVGGASTLAGAGAAPSALAFGLRHTF